MKKVLITGAKSYIGESFEKWVTERYPEEFQVDTVDMIGDGWRKKSFEGYDAVFHVAGLAHADVGKVSEETKAFYYKVNRDLTIETAEKAKADGVKQFVFMSSMIIYGESAGVGEKKVITKDTKPHPANFYGDSKWQADKGVRKLQDEKFHVAVVRPPMIYGKGSKGNYPLLAKLAVKLPIFPVVKNKRSMLYIDNLCEFIRLMIDNEEKGVFFPQNAEYANTSEMVKMIAKVKGHRIIMIPGMTPVVTVIKKVPGKIGKLAEKAFGDAIYEMSMSEYKKKYQIINLEKSIERTEK